MQTSPILALQIIAGKVQRLLHGPQPQSKPVISAYSLCCLATVQIHVQNVPSVDVSVPLSNFIVRQPPSVLDITLGPQTHLDTRWHLQV